MMNYITRSLESVVNQVTKEYPVVLVTGPRQVGKTTMLQKLMEERDRKSLERLEYLAHVHAFTRLGTFYWENFLVGENYYNSKYGKYNRRW